MCSRNLPLESSRKNWKCAKLFQLTPDGPSTEDICDIQAANKNLEDSINAWGTEDLGVGEVREIGDVVVLRACLELRGPHEDQQLGFLSTEYVMLLARNPGLLTMPLSMQSVPVRVLQLEVPASLETWGLRVDIPLGALRSGTWLSQMVLDWVSLLLQTDGGCSGRVAVPTLVVPRLRPGVSLALTSIEEGMGMTSSLSLVEAEVGDPESTRYESVSGA